VVAWRCGGEGKVGGRPVHFDRRPQEAQHRADSTLADHRGGVFAHQRLNDVADDGLHHRRLSGAFESACHVNVKGVDAEVTVADVDGLAVEIAQVRKDGHAARESDFSAPLEERHASKSADLKVGFRDGGNVVDRDLHAVRRLGKVADRAPEGALGLVPPEESNT